MLQLILVPLLAAAAPPAAIGPHEVVPGQQGVCITEWDGGERIEIPVEVIGLLDSTGPDRDVVLVRLLDPRFADGGVVAGMSGSPVYVDGKLLGAVAFGWSFSREPLAGVTPASRMRAMLDIPAGTVQATSSVSLDLLTAVAAGEASPEELAARLPQFGSDLPVAVALAGLPLPDAFGHRILQTAGLSAVAGGAGTAHETAPEAGDMVAALLVWGDATLAAAGTVTGAEKGRLLAFGHPLFALGEVRMPAARARVLAVQRNFQLAFKMYRVGPPFGAVVADRPAGIVVDPETPVTGIPLAVTVRDDTGEHTWRFELAPTPVLQPLLVTFLTNAALTARGAASGTTTVTMTQTATLDDGRSVQLRHGVRGPDARARVATLAGALMDLLANPPFPGPAVTGMAVTLEQRTDAPGLQLVHVAPSRTSLRPGQEFTVSIRLQPRGGDVVEKRVTMAVPASISPGTLDLIVADGAAWSEYQVRQQGLAPTRFDDQLAALSQLEPSTTLVVALESRDRGVAVAGRPQPALPPSWAATIATGLGRTSVQRLTTAPVAVFRSPESAPMTGAFRIPLTILDGARDTGPGNSADSDSRSPGASTLTRREP